jgi:REP element-mobilizing transposase RayT
MRIQAKRSLRFPPVRLTGRQALAVAHGFDKDKARKESGYNIHACCILPEHVHLVLGRHERAITRIAGHLKGRATQALRAEGLWPAEDRPVWANGSWNVFLNTPEEALREIRYASDNAMKECKPRQHWSFVTQYPPG